jgi:SOS response regulatory protein OraA/RecX
VETLARLGYLDDFRFAATRAASLAERGYGDAAIRFDLEREGVDEEAIVVALGALEPELDRAGSVVAGGVTPKLLRRLGAKGFSGETLESLSDGVEDEPPGHD